MFTADPRLEFHWLPDPGFLSQGFLIQCPRRASAINSIIAGTSRSTKAHRREAEGRRARPTAWLRRNSRLGAPDQRSQLHHRLLDLCQYSRGVDLRNDK